MLQTLYQMGIALLPAYPFVWAAVLIGVKYAFARLPAAQQAKFQALALQAVQACEQTQIGKPGEDKKAWAVAQLKVLLQDAGIKVNPVLLDVTVEAIVFGFNQLKQSVTYPGGANVPVPVQK